MVLGRLCITMGALQFAFGILAMAQSPQRPRGFTEEVGGLQSRYDHALWQSPEAILSALQSTTDGVRFDAFHLLGAEDEDAYELLHGKNGDAEIIATPWQSFLRYAALGDDATQDAVLAVQVRNSVLIAVAMPQNGKWNRIATFKCICGSNNSNDSYGIANGGDLLGSTVDIGRFSAGGFERHDLVLRVIDFPKSNRFITSFDEYIQHEAHFRVYGSELHRSIEFNSRYHSCRQSSCVLTRRWFYFHQFGPLSTIPGGILVEAEGIAERRGYETFRTDVEDRNLSFRSCSTLLFNDKTQEFETAPLPPSSIDPCGAFLQRRPSTPRQ